MGKYVIKDFEEGASGYYTDLACERRRADLSCSGVDYKKERTNVGYWEKIRITSEEGAQSIGRPIGNYDTLNLPPMNILDIDEIDDAKEELAKELCRMCTSLSVTPEKILVVGLGNSELTPDAIGPSSAASVKATMHIKNMDSFMFDTLECSEIAVLKPDVMANSGIDSYEMISGVCSKILPDVIFAIDALAARSPSRLGTTIQISGTGIFPGSGLGNHRMPLTEETLGVPVIAIGVPTVINSRMFVCENAEARAIRQKEGMFVCPKEINEIVKNAAAIISGGINQAFGICY